MAGEGKAAFTGAATAITAAVIIGLLTQKRAEAQPGSQVVTLDDPAMQALVGILQREESIDVDVNGVIEVLQNIDAGILTLNQAIAQLLGTPVPGMQNPKGMTAWVQRCAIANQAVQLPQKRVPNDKAVVITALHTNLGIIYVASNQPDATNANGSYWLIANEAIAYKIYDTSIIWISATSANDGVKVTVEQEE